MYGEVGFNSHDYAKNIFLTLFLKIILRIYELDDKFITCKIIIKN